jgi:hypothetical protein
MKITASQITVSKIRSNIQKTMGKFLQIRITESQIRITESQIRITESQIRITESQIRISEKQTRITESFYTVGLLNRS